MAAIGEQSLQWFAAERVAVDKPAEPDLPALVGEHSALLYRVALSVVRNPAEAEDIVQDAFLRVLQRRQELAAIVEVRAWLVRIVWNLALDRRRRIRPEQMDEAFAAALLSSTMPADEVLSESRRMAQVLAAIEHLPTKERQALLLSAMDELSTAEIAAVLGKSESGIRSLLFRARVHLRERLGKGDRR
ncbi:MAG TPA: sigma-70 family RNA polymerase sigma factor [Acidobacteriaceae bacterium]|nr:sigma-70 family RNA polymerase sigma factor [Acidobacteriaceae bacterium]